MVVPVFVVTGFLDSGKTTLVQDTLMEQEWIESGPTLLLLCEEGEEEYSEKYLQSKDMTMLKIDDFSQLNGGFFKNCDKTFHPVQVVVEYNGMWKLNDLLELDYPKNWQLQGIYSTVNGETLDMYLMNMRNILMEQLNESQLIVVNRCAPEVNRNGFRRALRVQNPMAQLIFEDMNGDIIQPSEEDLPYDVKSNPIVIEDNDYGVFYVDAYDHPEYYEGKNIQFKAQTFRPKGMKDDEFVPVRKIMTCCAADIRLYGYPCKIEKGTSVPMKKWYTVNARFAYESPGPMQGEQPVLYLNSLEPAQKPEEEVAYLG